jgi:alanyl-tRNA synthetase
VRKALTTGVVILGSVDDGRIQFVVGVTRDLTQRIKAGAVVMEVAAQAGGGGGGRPDFATGGGTEPAKMEAALQHAYTVVERALEEA